MMLNFVNAKGLQAWELELMTFTNGTYAVTACFQLKEHCRS